MTLAPTSIAMAFLKFDGWCFCRSIFPLIMLWASIYIILLEQSVMTECNTFTMSERHDCFHQHNSDVCLYAFGFSGLFFSCMLFARSLLAVDETTKAQFVKWTYFCVMLCLVFVIVYCSQFYENCAHQNEACNEYEKGHLQAYLAGIILSSISLAVMSVFVIRFCPILE